MHADLKSGFAKKKIRITRPYDLISLKLENFKTVRIKIKTE